MPFESMGVACQVRALETAQKEARSKALHGAAHARGFNNNHSCPIIQFLNPSDVCGPHKRGSLIWF
jgi:hypothetical protein